MSKSPAAILYDSDGANPVGTPTHPLRTDPTGSTAQPVSATALPLPTGASTATLQTTGNASLSSIDGKTPALVTGRVPVDGSGVTQPVSGPLTDAQLRATPVPVSTPAGGYGGQVEGRAADGAAQVGNPVLIAGHDETLVRTLLTDTLGRLVVAPAGAAGTTKGFVAGEMVQAASTVAPIRKTVYTEPAANAQRSIASASANDSSAGTGARQVQICYYDTTGAGPFTEIVTMNGTTPVNTVATNIRFIECLKVVSVGSGGVNAGIISLFGATGGGGGTVWTIAASDNKAFGAHHYVATGQKCFVTGLLIGIKGADTTSGFIRAKNPTVATSPEIQVSDTLRAPSSGQSFRSYGTPIVIAGPARVTVFIAPDSTSSRTYYGSFDFYEEVA